MSSSTCWPSREDDWQLCISRSLYPGLEYWFHTRSGVSFWQSPDKPVHKLAIIVPYRDLHAEQKRAAQMQRFIPEMTELLLPTQIPFKIYIVEQSNDKRKFNRGKLLNVGFVLACQEGYDTFVLHDVDLLPSADLLPYYTTHPSQPVHIARVWNRYNENEKYFGGVVNFSRTLYEQVNGYPNNFWGWGGEDDELYIRTATENKLEIASPSEGSLTDMEEMDLTSKLDYLKKNELLKCNNRWELLKEHSSTWRTNGISSFYAKEEFTELKREYMNDYSVKVTVELALNNHWSDSLSGVDDIQYDKTANTTANSSLSTNK